MNLLVGDPGGALVNPGEGAGAGGIVGEFLDRVTGGARVKCGHRKKDTADECEFHEIRAADSERSSKIDTPVRLYTGGEAADDCWFQQSADE